MATYQRLSLIEREEISRQIASGCSIRKIAASINRTPSTISREIRRSVVDIGTLDFRDGPVVPRI